MATDDGKTEPQVSESTVLADSTKEVSDTKFTVNMVNNKKKKTHPSLESEITIREFLDFLKTAYQVQENIEGVLLADGMKQAVDWIKLKDSTLVKPRANIACQTSVTNLTKNEGKPPLTKSKSDSFIENNHNEPLKKKLHEVLSEGLLDSMLPYIVPAIPLLKRPATTKITERTSNTNIKTAGIELKKKDHKDNSKEHAQKSTTTKTDSEIEIHVCDEVKNVKKDFVCNQKLLVEKMGYFADVTVGQKLEDMDISVHCDIGIFDWLMRWVKKESTLEEDWPQLDPQCVIPVLVSAAFLQMEPLLQDCLLYCHQHMSEILRTTTNLSCLNDSVLTRLAAMYTNAEVETIRDRKDKIQSRLFCKLIQSLCEPDPESVRGHWNSLAKAYRCSRCQQLVIPSVAPYVPCVPQCMRLQPDGSIISHHVRDIAWNINDYILRLQKSLKTWRKVYWRLWGDAHFLYCTTCKKYFPTHQIGWCRHHPDPPQFFTVDAQKAPLPVGRFPCCGERAYRFQLLDNFAGCQFREHTPCTKNVKDAAILAMLETYRHLIEEEPPQLLFPERLTRLVARDATSSEGKLSTKESFWWDGLQIVPQRRKLGLLGSCFAERSFMHTSAEESSDEYSDEDNATTGSSSPSPSRGSEDTSSITTSTHSGRKSPQQKKRRRKKEHRLWQAHLSVRSNQDIQRSREEAILKKINAVLSRRTSMCLENIPKPPKGFSRNVNPPGGVWVRLESEWKESHAAATGQTKSRNIFNGKLKMKPNRP